MPERVVRAQQAVGVGYRREVFVEHLLLVDNGAYLQQVERPCAVGVEVTCELYLHRSAHSLCTEAHRHLQQLGQRKHTLLQHSGERYHLSATLVQSVAYHLVVWVVGRGDKVERVVALRLLHLQI